MAKIIPTMLKNGFEENGAMISVIGGMNTKTIFVHNAPFTILAFINEKTAIIVASKKANFRFFTQRGCKQIPIVPPKIAASVCNMSNEI